jgi:hypothetical protein
MPPLCDATCKLSESFSCSLQKLNPTAFSVPLKVRKIVNFFLLKTAQCLQGTRHHVCKIKGRRLHYTHR